MLGNFIFLVSGQQPFLTPWCPPRIPEHRHQMRATRGRGLTHLRGPFPLYDVVPDDFQGTQHCPQSADFPISSSWPGAACSVVLRLPHPETGRVTHAHLSEVENSMPGRWGSRWCSLMRTAVSGMAKDQEIRWEQSQGSWEP